MSIKKYKQRNKETKKQRNKEIKKQRKEFESHGEKETRQYAAGFVKKLNGGEILILEGELGSGKSTFVRGLGKALGIKKTMRSPTFTLMNVYKISGKSKIKNFIHVDAYRLCSVQDLRNIGLFEYIGNKDTVIAIEWGEKLKSLFKKLDLILIKFKHGESESCRLIIN